MKDFLLLNNSFAKFSTKFSAQFRGLHLFASVSILTTNNILIIRCGQAKPGVKGSQFKQISFFKSKH